MYYLWGALAGLAYGAGIGYLKYRFLWKRYMNKDDSAAVSRGEVYGRLLAGWIILFAALFLLYLLERFLPFSYSAALIGAAASLSVLGIILPLRKIRKLGF